MRARSGLVVLVLIASAWPAGAAFGATDESNDAVFNVSKTDRAGRREAVVDALTRMRALPSAKGSSQSPLTAGGPKCAGQVATHVGTAGADVITGTAGDDVIVGLGGADTIKGKGGADLICSGPGNDIVEGGKGADNLIGGDGADVLRGQKGSDILLGMDGSDSLWGGPGVDALAGMAGGDYYNGGPSTDLVAFLDSPRAVVVDLAKSSATGEGADTIQAAEAIMGSNWGDVLLGNGSENMFFGGEGADLIDGRKGHDAVLYTFADASVDVDLKDQYAVGGEGVDSLVSIQSAVGSAFDDFLYGTSGYNLLDGSGGFDEVFGRGGVDVCWGESLSSCILMFDGSDAPPDEVTTAGAQDLPPLPGPPADPGTVPGPPFAPPPGGDFVPGQDLFCPVMAGTAYFLIPPTIGYGYWTYQITRWSTSSEWLYGPWIYYNGATWIAYVSGLWFSIDNQIALPMNETSAIVTAYYYSYSSGTFAPIGQCRTQGLNMWALG